MSNEKEINELKEWFLNEKKADESSFDDFLEYCLWRGLFNDSLMAKVAFTKANCEKLHKEFQSPIKRTAKLLGLTYKELAEQIGYTEGTLKNIVSKKNISISLTKTLEFLVKNNELNKKIDELGKQNELLKAELAKNRTETAPKTQNEPKPSQDIKP